ncbi:hypothetical protein ACT691_20675 [Vibrio metschnikovii]
MSELLALLAQIIESSQRLRAQMMQNRITEAVATNDLAIKMRSGDKCSDAQRKFCYYACCWSCNNGDVYRCHSAYGTE